MRNYAVRNFRLNLLGFERTLKLAKTEPLFAIRVPLQFVYVCKLRKNKDVYEKLIKNYLKSIRAVSCEL